MDVVPQSTNVLQSDKVNLSRLLLSQMPRRLAFAAEHGRYCIKRLLCCEFT